MLGDFMHAVRTLRRSPAYALTVVATLALGIGAVTAVTSVLRSVLLEPLPYAAGDRVVLAFERDSTGNERLASYPTFEDWRAGTQIFEGLTFVRGIGAVMKTTTGAERLLCAYVTEDFFQVLPVVPVVGRMPAVGEWAQGSPAVTVLSNHLWRRRFGGDPGVVGRSIVLGERSYTVIGVLPVGYQYPTWADLYAPISIIAGTDPALGQRGLHADSRIVGRLRPGVDSTAARLELSAVAARLADTYPAENGGWRSVSLYPVATEVLGDTGSQLKLLTAAVVLVLLIACVNVANLSFARATTRGRELAVRTALGAGRGALLRLLAGESILLGLTAGVVGMAVAVWLLDLLKRTARDVLPRVDEIVLDPSVVFASTLVCVAAVVLFGLLPALGSVTGTLAEGLREGAGGGTSRRRQRLRDGLVVAEFALALLLLAGASLLVRSLSRLQEVKTGFVPEGLLAASVQPPSPRYDDPDRAVALYRALAEAVAAVPGVVSVALTNHVPLSGASMPTRVVVDGAPADADDEGRVIFRVADTAYFRTAGVPLLAGRDFSGADMRNPAGAVIVNQTLARRYWPDRSPIGQPITVFKSAQGRKEFGEAVRTTVAGVVGDVRHYAPEIEPVPEVYVPYTLTVWPWMTLLVKVRAEPEATSRRVAAAILEVEPDIPLEGPLLRSGVYQLTESLRDTLGYRRLITGLLTAFAIPALLLAAIGLYGVIAYVTAQRAREIAIRMAVGASPRSVLGLMLGKGLRLALAGVAFGILGALAGTRVLESQLYGVTSRDPVSLFAAALTLTLVAVLATLLPARRAARVDPMQALRAE